MDSGSKGGSAPTQCEIFLDFHVCCSIYYHYCCYCHYCVVSLVCWLLLVLLDISKLWLDTLLDVIELMPAQVISKEVSYLHSEIKVAFLAAWNCSCCSIHSAAAV